MAKQASNVAARKFKTKRAKPSAEELELLRREKQQQKMKSYFEDHKKVFKPVAFEAAKKVLLKEINTSKQQHKLQQKVTP